jgi:hypothetical protein
MRGVLLLLRSTSFFVKEVDELHEEVRTVTGIHGPAIVKFNWQLEFSSQLDNKIR